MSNSVAPETPGRRRLERGTKGGETQQLNALRRSFDIIPSLEIHLTSWKMDRPRPMELVTCPRAGSSRDKSVSLFTLEKMREKVYVCNRIVSQREKDPSLHPSIS